MAIPELLISALILRHLRNEARARFGDATALGDVKALAPRQAHSESPSTELGAFAQKRAGEAHAGCHKAARKLDANLGTPAEVTGPAGVEMNTKNPGLVYGYVVGTVGEIATQIRDSPTSSPAGLAPSTPPPLQHYQEQERRHLHTAHPPLDRICCTPRMGKSSSRQVP